MIGMGECHLDSDDFASLYQPDFSLKMLQILSGDFGGAETQLLTPSTTTINRTLLAGIALITMTDLLLYRQLHVAKPTLPKSWTHVAQRRFEKKPHVVRLFIFQQPAGISRSGQ